jgi:nucleoside 2-deoxyribosyltransferase
MKSVYLAGPITLYNGLEPKKSWRAAFQDVLEGEDGLKAVSPEDFDVIPVITSDTDVQPQQILALQKAISAKARYDVLNTDLFLAHLMDNNGYVSIGTMIQLGWASLAGKPIVVVMELGEHNPHDHAMVRDLATYIAFDLEDARRFIKEWLL